VIQTLIIVCGVLNIIPITGVTLPFVSYGGSSLLSQFLNIGILYYISANHRASDSNGGAAIEKQS
jgi:cell division protein FtsW (lipid II flippase)